MESANLHHQHHQVQDQLVGSSSSSSSSSPSLTTTPSSYGAATAHAWAQNNITLNNTGNFNFFSPRQKNEAHLFPPLINSTSMIQDLAGFHWNSISNAGNFTDNQSAHRHDLQHLAKIKEELSSSSSSDSSFPKFTDLLNSPSSIIEDSHLNSTSYIKNEQIKDPSDELSEKLLLKTLSSSFPISNGHIPFSPGEIYNVPSRSGSFSHIYPSINISNLNQSSSSSSISSTSFDMNLQALDFLPSTRFSGDFCHPSHHDNLGIYKESLPFVGLDGMQQSSHRPLSDTNNKTSSFANEITEAKRSSSDSSLADPKATTTTTQAASKKSRLESRASCPPFKVRKEKLGDRISALQQLVAPFGKTDTASVLMEAIGYIKFLQNQVETLSVPYMKSSRSKANGMQAARLGMEDGNEEPRRDLRSRGLCLVPLSCMSYVTSGDGGGGGGIWPPPNFGGGT